MHHTPCSWLTWWARALSFICSPGVEQGGLSVGLSAFPSGAGHPTSPLTIQPRTHSQPPSTIIDVVSDICVGLTNLVGSRIIDTFLLFFRASPWAAVYIGQHAYGDAGLGARRPPTARRSGHSPPTTRKQRRQSSGGAGGLRARGSAKDKAQGRRRLRVCEDAFRAESLNTKVESNCFAPPYQPVSLVAGSW